MRAKLNDPKQLKKKVKQAADFCQSIIDAALGGKKATGKVKTFIDKYQSGRTAKTGESEAYQLAATVGSQLNRMYQYYGYYLGAIQKQKEDKIKYGTMDFSSSDVESYAKDVQNQFNTIIQQETNKERTNEVTIEVCTEQPTSGKTEHQKATNEERHGTIHGQIK